MSNARLFHALLLARLQLFLRATEKCSRDLAIFSLRSFLASEEDLLMRIRRVWMAAASWKNCLWRTIAFVAWRALRSGRCCVVCRWGTTLSLLSRVPVSIETETVCSIFRSTATTLRRCLAFRKSLVWSNSISATISSTASVKFSP